MGRQDGTDRDVTGRAGKARGSEARIREGRDVARAGAARELRAPPAMPLRPPPGLLAVLWRGWVAVLAAMAVSLACNLLDWPILGLVAGGGVGIALMVRAVPGWLWQSLWTVPAIAALCLPLVAAILLLALSSTSFRLLGSAVVPTEGLMPRADLAVHVEGRRFRGRTPVRLVVAPLLPPWAPVPSTGAEQEIALWVVRPAAGGWMSTPRPWSRPAPFALELPAFHAGLARDGIRAIEARHGLRAGPALRLVVWVEDASAEIAQMRARMGRVVAGALVGWPVLLLLGALFRRRRLPAP